MDGGQDPLFKRAILQSPAFEWQWNQSGSLNTTYTQFADLAGCPTGALSCLQAKDTTDLQKANQELFRSDFACLGIFPVGPSVDGRIITTLPAVAFQTGRTPSPHIFLSKLIMLYEKANIGQDSRL